MVPIEAHLYNYTGSWGCFLPQDPHLLLSYFLPQTEFSKMQAYIVGVRSGREDIDSRVGFISRLTLLCRCAWLRCDHPEVSGKRSDKLLSGCGPGGATPMGPSVPPCSNWPELPPHPTPPLLYVRSLACVVQQGFWGILSLVFSFVMLVKMWVATMMPCTTLPP